MKKFSTYFWLIIATTFVLSSADEHRPSLCVNFQTTCTYNQKNSLPLIAARRLDLYKHRNNIGPHETIEIYTAEQLLYYFTTHHYSEEKILNQPLLYLSNEFVKLAKTYPQYEKTISLLHEKLQNFGRLKKVLHIFAGTYSPGLKKRIAQLYQEIEQKKQLQISDQKHAYYNSIMNQYSELQPVYAQYSPLLAKAVEKRIQARDSLDQLQHAIHLETANIIQKTNMLATRSIIYPHQNTLTDCAAAIKDYNKKGILDKAMCVADFCWALLDYGQAIAEGTALGLYSAAQDLIENPIEASICIVAGKQILAYQLCKVIYHVADIGLTAITDQISAKEKWNDYIAPINNLISAIENKEITLRDSLKTGAAFVVGYKAQSKLLGGLGKFCKTIKQRTVSFTKNNPLFSPQDYLITPEGMLLKATNNIKNNFKKNNPSILKNTIENKITKKKSIKRLIKQEGLPCKGKLRYVPPKKLNVSEGKLPVSRMANGKPGFIDRFGNIWVQGDSRTKGQSHEWDVQLSKQGIRQVGWMTRDNSHLNVSLDGRVTHK